MGRESVKSFLRQCIEYADKSIQRKQKRGDEEEVIQAEISRFHCTCAEGS